MNFENRPQLGMGIYTPREIADLLKMDYAKVNRWISAYWDGELGKEFEQKYSWKIDGSKAVSFHTFVELYVMLRFSEAGVKPREVLKAHKILSKKYDTAFPFAQREVLMGISTDGNKVFLRDKDGNIITLDGTRQLNLDIIQIFFKKLEFDADDLAARYYPMGKEKQVIMDPKRKFGHPVMGGTNIYPETFFGMYKAGEPRGYIAALYEVDEQLVQDAIDYCMAA